MVSIEFWNEVCIKGNNGHCHFFKKKYVFGDMFSICMQNHFKYFIRKTDNSPNMLMSH